MDFLVPFFLGFLSATGIFLRWIFRIWREGQQEYRQRQIDALTGKNNQEGHHET